MNLPNKLTILRVVLIPFLVVCMLVDSIPANRYIALAIFCVASVTDFFDGMIARKYNLITNFGKFMDPLADKLLVCTSLILFVGEGSLYAVVAIVIIAREFVISGFRLVASDSGVVLAASWWGKSKTVAQMVLCILLFLNFSDVVWFSYLTQVAIFVSLALTVISMCDYIWKNRNVMKES